MKKLIVTILSVCTVFALSACGNMRTNAVVPTELPYVTANPNDGIVTDNDGIITDDNTNMNGTVNGNGTDTRNGTGTEVGGMDNNRRTGTKDVPSNTVGD